MRLAVVALVCFGLTVSTGCSNDAPEAGSVGAGSAAIPTKTGHDELDPPAELASELEKLPAHPGRVISEAGAAQGPDRVGAAFYTKDTPEQVILFFEEELRAAGWVSTGPAKTTTSQPKLDGTSASGVSEEFAKPGFRLFVTAGVTYKDPSQFQTLYGLVLDRVK